MHALFRATPHRATARRALLQPASVLSSERGVCDQQQQQQRSDMATASPAVLLNSYCYCICYFLCSAAGAAAPGGVDALVVGQRGCPLFSSAYRPQHFATLTDVQSLWHTSDDDDDADEEPILALRNISFSCNPNSWGAAAATA